MKYFKFAIVLAGCAFLVNCGGGGGSDPLKSCVPGVADYDAGNTQGTADNQAATTAGQADGEAAAKALTADQGVTDGYNEGYNDTTNGYPAGYNIGYNDPNLGYPAGYSYGYSTPDLYGGATQACSNGTTDGNNDGYAKGKSTGESDGYNAGYNDGYGAGQSDGVNNCPAVPPPDPCNGDFCCQNPSDPSCQPDPCNGDYCCQNPTDPSCNGGGGGGTCDPTVDPTCTTSNSAATALQSGSCDPTKATCASGATARVSISQVIKQVLSPRAKSAPQPTQITTQSACWQKGYNAIYNKDTYTTAYNQAFSTDRQQNQPYWTAYQANYPLGEADGYAAGLTAGESDGYSVGQSDGRRDADGTYYTPCYNTAYASSYTDGYSYGYNDSSGYDAGYNAGYSAGYTDGQNSCPTSVNISPAVKATRIGLGLRLTSVRRIVGGQMSAAEKTARAKAKAQGRNLRPIAGAVLVKRSILNVILKKDVSRLDHLQSVLPNPPLLDTIGNMQAPLRTGAQTRRKVQKSVNGILRNN